MECGIDREWSLETRDWRLETSNKCKGAGVQGRKRSPQYASLIKIGELRNLCALIGYEYCCVEIPLSAFQASLGMTLWWAESRSK